jgi:cell division septation protein DedD
MDKFLAEVRQEYDLVLIDAPPVLPVADSSLLATKVDGVILIYQVGKVPRNSLVRAKERIENVKARLLGIVLNDIRPEVSGASYVSQYYMHYYGEHTDRPLKKKSGKTEKPLHMLPFGLIGALTIELSRIGLFRLIISLSIIVLFIGSATFALLHRENRTASDRNASAIEAALEMPPELTAQKEMVTAATKNGPEVTKTPSIADTFFTIQLYTWKSREKAEETCAALLRKGIPAWLDKIISKNNTIVYRVCAGKFGSYDETEAAFKAQGLNDKSADAFFVRVAPAADDRQPVLTKKNGPKPVTGTTAAAAPGLKPHVLQNTTESRFFSLQLFSYAKLEKAQEINEYLSSQDIPAWIEKASIKGKGVFYRVCAGKFESKVDAMAYRERLNKKKYKDAIIIYRGSTL